MAVNWTRRPGNSGDYEKEEKQKGGCKKLIIYKQ